MSDPAAPDRATGLAAVLTGPDARPVLAAALAAEDLRLLDARVRSVHRRGATSIAVVHRVRSLDEHGHRRDRLWVTHATDRPVPVGATRVEVGGGTVHCWPFPQDPYLPGLPAAVRVADAAALLRRQGHDTVRPAIRTRSYRPTRRAVVELRASPDAAPAAYVKLLGGRRPARVRERTTRLAAVHAWLRAAGVPVPDVRSHDPDEGRIVLGAVPGTSLRASLRGPATAPAPGRVVELLTTLRATPAPPAGGEPDAFADIERHVPLLRSRLPHRAADLRLLTAVAGAVGGPVGTVHGDLHDGQVVVEDGRVTGLLDVDHAGTGHVAHDLGRLLAAVEASADAATTPQVAEVHRYLHELRAAVADHCPAADVAAATAAAWVGLATGPLRTASPSWRRQVEQRLDRALAWARDAR